MSGPVLHVGKVAGISGSEAHLLLCSRSCASRGWDVRFLMLHEDEPGAWEFAARLERAGVPVEGVRLPHAADPIAFRRIARVVRGHRPVLLHTHLVHADFHGLLAGRAGARAVAREPSTGSTRSGSALLRRGDRTSVGSSTSHRHLAGLARYLAETEGFAESSFEVVHYGIVRPGPSPAVHRRRLALPLIGRLIPIKGHDTLLRAIAIAARELPEPRAGDRRRGAARAARSRRSRASSGSTARCASSATCPGASGDRASAVVLVPSLGEGFGMVALEAMERGRPVVASAVGGLPEIVAAGETGLLGRPG